MILKTMLMLKVNVLTHLLSYSLQISSLDKLNATSSRDINIAFLENIHTYIVCIISIVHYLMISC